MLYFGSDAAVSLSVAWMHTSVQHHVINKAASPFGGNNHAVTIKHASEINFL